MAEIASLQLIALAEVVLGAAANKSPKDYLLHNSLRPNRIKKMLKSGHRPPFSTKSFLL